MKKYHWTMLPKPPFKEMERFYNELKIDKTLLTLLYQRGISNYNQAYYFFRPSQKHLHDPFLMKDMQVAVRRLEAAILNQESVLIYGDYDVDGTTSVAMMSLYLERFSSKIFTYIPDRYTEGYGVSIKGIDFAYDNDISLIISLDCGIKDVEKVAYAKEKGIDFIICDHHLPSKQIPNAVAVLNPKREDCSYPYKELSGCGVGFKLIQAFQQYVNRGFNEIEGYLSWVAISIAADIVPIMGENRVLTHLGLIQLNDSPAYGIQALLSQKTDIIDIHDLVFTLAPRINAAGRIKHARYALELMKSSDRQSANYNAQIIEELNTERKNLDKQITEQALCQIQDNGEQNCKTTVVASALWHKGVIGIVASRLIEKYYRPTIVFAEKDGVLSGSARSVEGIDIYDVLTDCSEYLLQFGGHKSAAGMTLKKENYIPFKESFEKQVSLRLTSNTLLPKIEVSQYLDLSKITDKWYSILKQFAPFGPCNMRPVFLTQNLRGNAQKIGATKEHLKIYVRDDNNVTMEAIGFNLGEYCDQINLGESFSMVYCVEQNNWKGKTRYQLHIKDISFQ